jgi:hypothetical protein
MRCGSDSRSTTAPALVPVEGAGRRWMKMASQADIMRMFRNGKSFKLEDGKVQARAGASGNLVPSVSVFEAVYSNQTLSVNCVVVPGDPSTASITLLLVVARHPSTDTIFCSGYSVIDSNGGLPPMGLGLRCYCDTSLFDPLLDGNIVDVGYFCFSTNAQGESIAFEALKKLTINASAAAATTKRGGGHRK